MQMRLCEAQRAPHVAQLPLHARLLAVVPLLSGMDPAPQRLDAVQHVAASAALELAAAVGLARKVVHVRAVESETPAKWGACVGFRVRPILGIYDSRNVVDAKSRCCALFSSVHPRYTTRMAQPDTFDFDKAMIEQNLSGRRRQQLAQQLNDLEMEVERSCAAYEGPLGTVLTGSRGRYRYPIAAALGGWIGLVMPGRLVGPAGLLGTAAGALFLWGVPLAYGNPPTPSVCQRLRAEVAEATASHEKLLLAERTMTEKPSHTSFQAYRAATNDLYNVLFASRRALAALKHA